MLREGNGAADASAWRSGAPRRPPTGTAGPGGDLLVLPRAVLERLCARAIGEGVQLEAVVEEILEGAPE
jgi:hypothetical protein